MRGHHNHGASQASCGSATRCFGSVWRPLLLEEELLPHLQLGCGAIAVYGHAGSGKTTALQHLSAILPTDLNVLLLDEPANEEILAWSSVRPVVFASTLTRPVPVVAEFHLATWNQDDLIEYLLRRHKSRCA